MKTRDQLVALYDRLGQPEWTNFSLTDLSDEDQCRIGAFVLADHDGQVILIRRTPIPAHPGIENYWWIPGGGQEGDETPDQTAQREFEEETGLKVSLQRTLLTKLGERFIAVFFRGEVLNGELSSQVDPDRITAEARRFPSGQVPFDKLWSELDKILLVREGFVIGEVAELFSKNGLKQRHNQASHATSEPAPGADSSAHQG